MVCYSNSIRANCNCRQGYVSTKAIQLLTEHNIDVILLDSFGNLVCNMGRKTPSFRIAPTMEKGDWKLALSRKNCIILPNYSSFSGYVTRTRNLFCYYAPNLK